jgi:hypothetical protein
MGANERGEGLVILIFRGVGFEMVFKILPKKSSCGVGRTRGGVKFDGDNVTCDTQLVPIR